MAARHIRSLLILWLAAGLGGCWYATEPLIFQQGATQPVAAGHYLYHARGDEPVEVEIQQIPGGGYLYHSEDEAMSVFAHRVADGWYAVQFSGSGNNLLFAAARVAGGRIDFYEPPCDDELGALAGVEREDEDCLFTDRAGLFAAVRLIAARVERGEEVEATGWAEAAAEQTGQP